MHRLKVRAFRLLEVAGVLTFHAYTPQEGYALTTVADQRREVGSLEAGAYVLGAHDMFQAVRYLVDEVAGDVALNMLDARLQDLVTEAAEAFEDGGVKR